MFETIETIAGDVPLQIVAGATLALSVSASVIFRLATPRPCWKGNGCLLKQANPDACPTCSIFHDYRMNGSLIKAQPELGEIRRLSVLGATSD